VKLVLLEGEKGQGAMSRFQSKNIYYVLASNLEEIAISF
jgi:hypothetical protein